MEEDSPVPAETLHPEPQIGDPPSRGSTDTLRFPEVDPELGPGHMVVILYVGPLIPWSWLLTFLYGTGLIYFGGLLLTIS
jgi:hypothetical protein